MCHQGAGVHCRAVASTPARAGRSPREFGSPGSAASVAWGTSGSCLRPFRLLGRQGAASSYVETPTWKSRRALDQGSRGHVGEVLDMHPPNSGAENISPGCLAKGGVSIDFSRKATRSQLRCTHSDVGRFNASHVHHPREDPASRGLWSAYIACASKQLSSTKSRTQPWARAASASPSSSARRTRTS